MGILISCNTKEYKPPSFTLHEAEHVCTHRPSLPGLLCQLPLDHIQSWPHFQLWDWSWPKEGEPEEPSSSYSTGWSGACWLHTDFGHICWTWIVQVPDLKPRSSMSAISPSVIQQLCSCTSNLLVSRIPNHVFIYSVPVCSLLPRWQMSCSPDAVSSHTQMHCYSIAILNNLQSCAR